MAVPEEKTVRIESGATYSVPAPYQSHASFMSALRAGERGALQLFFDWYSPLLRDQARKVGVPEGERAELVTTVLDDVAMHLLQCDEPPRELARYLVGALRNRARSRHRDGHRRAATEERAYTDSVGGRERVVAESHSEYGIRTSRPIDDDEHAGLRAAVAKIAARSAQALTEGELTLLIGVSNHVPMRELAKQAGIPYGTARVRLHRLRERFRKLAIQHVASLEPEEQREMLRFFRRAGVQLETSEAAGSGRHRHDAVTFVEE